ncbi:MAG: hypothetical protein V1820_02355 [archaeon]
MAETEERRPAEEIPGTVVIAIAETSKAITIVCNGEQVREIPNGKADYTVLRELSDFLLGTYARNGKAISVLAIDEKASGYLSNCLVKGRMERFGNTHPEYVPALMGRGDPTKTALAYALLADEASSVTGEPSEIYPRLLAEISPAASAFIHDKYCIAMLEAGAAPANQTNARTGKV